jgi:UDP-2,3-diacylglucosamine pyrophosphatase LpxH
MAGPHDTFLERLQASTRISLVARLNDPVVVGKTNEKYLHVLVPDLHLISEDQRPKYRYGFDWRDEFAALTGAILETRNALSDQEHRMVVTQLGDFVDLWRESGNDPSGLGSILDTFYDIRDHFVRNAEDSVGARLLLGNHDLEARQSRNFARARLGHYLPGRGKTVLATHGDAFDFWETAIPDDVAAFAVRTFGRLVNPLTYPMEELRALREKKTRKNQREKIQGDVAFAETLPADRPVPERFNVIDVDRAGDRRRAHRLLPNIVKAVGDLRTLIEDDGKPVAPNLKLVVIGHTHHARLVVDHKAGLVLMDCGAWIENHQVRQQQKRPNRQIGAICGSDLRIYQFG